jgi:peptide/nickel transport system substrate-binding protein
MRVLPPSPRPSLSFRRTRTTAALGLAALMTLGVGGCRAKKQTEEHRRGVAVVVPMLRSTWIRNFNPFFMTQARWPAPAGIYEPLIVFNRATGEFVPWLGTKWYWENDNKTLVIEVRRGVEFADGVKLTPRDVVFTFELMKKFPALDNFAVWKHLMNVEERGQEVCFHFKYPFALPGLSAIGERPIVPEHSWRNVADPVKYSDENPNGTGPFNRILSFKPQVYELGKNPRYWQPGKPKLDAVRVPAMAGNEQQALALINGDIDWGAAFLPSIDRIFVSKDPEHRGYVFRSLEGTVMLYANTTRKPFDDVRVRKGLSHAINRERIVRIAMQNYTRAADATALSDLYAKYHDPKVLAEEGDWTKFDQEKARALLDEAGLKLGPEGFRTRPDGKPFKVDVNCVVGWSDWIIASQLMVKDLRAVGIDATLRTYEYGAWFNRLQVGNFDLSIAWSDGDAAPSTFYQRLMSKSTVRPLGEPAENNWHRFASARAEELIQQFAATTDPAEQLRLGSELSREYVRTAPTIPLFPGPSWGEYNSKRITGFPTKDNQYAVLAPYKVPALILTLVELQARDAASDSSLLNSKGAP